MFKKIKTLLFLLISILCFLQLTVSADSLNDGFKYYGFFNLSNSVVEVDSESIFLDVNEDKLSVDVELLLRNKSSDEQSVTLGTPYVFSSNIKVLDRGNSLKIYKKGIANINKSDVLSYTEEKTWLVFNINLKPNESRLIKISGVSYNKIDSNGQYKIYILSDKLDKSLYNGYIRKLNVKLQNYCVYNKLKFIGQEPDYSSLTGELAWNINSQENLLGNIEIIYQYMDSALLDTLLLSKDRNLMYINKSFKAKDYEKTILLCDQYIESAETNNSLIETVKFIKAECMRKLLRNSEYLETLNSVDISKLSVPNIDLKTTYDKLEIASAYGDSKEVEKLQQELNLKDTNDFFLMKNWIKLYKFNESSNINNKNIDKLDQKSSGNKFFGLLIYNFKKLKYFDYFQIALLIIIFIIGFMIGRGSRNRRHKRRTTYIYRNYI